MRFFKALTSISILYQNISPNSLIPVQQNTQYDVKLLNLLFATSLNDKILNERLVTILDSIWTDPKITVVHPYISFAIKQEIVLNHFI